jgi:hypothetical protein
MDNLEMVRWELRDRTAAHERLVEDVRLGAELAGPKPAVRAHQAVFSVLIGLAGVVFWLVAR